MSAIATAEAGSHSVAHALPPDEYFGSATPGKIGMWIFLLSDAFSFGGLLLAYGILRGGSTVREMCPNPEDAAEVASFAAKYGKDVISRCWHNPYLHEPHLGINFTAGLTFLLICSSVTMVMAHAACVEGNRKKTLQYLGLTILG